MACAVHRVTCMKHLLATSALVALLCGCGSNDPISDPKGSTNTNDDGTTATDDTTTTTQPEICGTIVGEGYTIGQIAENWSLPDHLGAMFDLMDVCGKVIFYEEGSMW